MSVTFKTGVARVAILAALSLVSIGGPSAASPAPSPAPSAAEPAARSTVRTLAGDGRAGFRDGPALSARFMLPAAVAFDRTGRIVIADEGAQRIRLLANGQVTTIAGSGEEIALGQHVKGGYQDGPARQARFNDPSGIAIGADGSIYVADKYNHCIRRIKDGAVSTFAGAPERAGTADGPQSSAQFMYPIGLALDADGNLYVADSTVGIRQIDRQGTVTTLKSGAESKAFVGVATWGTGPSLVVFAIDNHGTFQRYRPGKTAESWRYAEEIVSPQMGGVAAVGEDAFLVSDVRANVIRSLTLPKPPFVANAIADVVGGTAVEDWGRSAGYEDGPPDRAKFFAPLGLAVRGREVVIADAGNRRLRVMPLPDMRGPIAPGSQELTPDPAHYRILFVGQSGAFYGTGWSTSIPGRIETLLLADRTRLQLPKPPKVSAMRMDSAGVRAIRDFIETYASDGQFDLVVVSLGSDTVEPDALRALDAKLRRSGTRLFVLVMPRAAVSVIEAITNNQVPLQAAQTGYAQVESEELSAARVLSSAGIRSYAALPDVIQYESGDRRLPLYLPNDVHPSDAGRAFIAQQIVKQISTWHPWTLK